MSIATVVGRGYGFVSEGTKWIPTAGYSIASLVVAAFSDDAINRSFVNYVNENYTEVAVVVFDEEIAADLEPEAEYVLFGIQSFSHPTRRRTSNKRFSVHVSVECHVKPGTNIYRIQRIADSVASLLSQCTFDVQDFDADGAIVGKMMFREVQAVDETKEQNQLVQYSGSKVCLEVAGVAEET